MRGDGAEAGTPDTVLLLGANGTTGRLVAQQALERGRRVRALTRNPDGFPIRHDRLVVVGGDATVPAVAARALGDADAVISVIGAAYGRRPRRRTCPGSTAPGATSPRS